MSWPTAGVVLCVGEALAVLTPADGRPLQVADVLAVGEAGAEVNVAVHLARLGVPARFAGRVGNDPLGRRLRSALRREGVDVDGVVLDDRGPTGLYLKDPGSDGTAVHYYRQGSAATSLDVLAAAVYAGVSHVHLTGITPALSATCAGFVRREVHGDRAHSVSFDVNYRPALWDPSTAAPELLDLAGGADVVFVGLDEAEMLWDARTAQEVRDLLPGRVEVVVKNGGDDAVAFPVDGGRAEAAALPVEVLEPVGAGDAFAAGYLATRLEAGDAETALRVGHAVAAGALRARSDHGVGLDARLLNAARTGVGWPHPRAAGTAHVVGG